jgi:hypothetical protein
MKKHLLTLGLILAGVPALASASSLDLELSDADQAQALTSTEITASAASACLDDYRKWRNQTAIKSGLAPFVGIAGAAVDVGLVIGWEYGGWSAFKSAIGPIGRGVAYAGITYVLPLTFVVGTITYETFSVSRFAKASKAYRLVKGLYDEGSDSRPFLKLLKQVHRRRPDLDRDQIKAALLRADADGTLCDGSLVKGRRIFAGKLHRRLATLKDMKKMLIEL